MMDLTTLPTEPGLYYTRTDGGPWQFVDYRTLSRETMRIHLEAYRQENPDTYEEWMRIDPDEIERLHESEEKYRLVISEDCPTDERHCTCVPHLRRRIAELEAELGVRERTDKAKPSPPVCQSPSYPGLMGTISKIYIIR